MEGFIYLIIAVLCLYFVINTKRKRIKNMQELLVYNYFENKVFPIFVNESKSYFKQVGFCSGFSIKKGVPVFIMSDSILDRYQNDKLYFKGSEQYIPIGELEEVEAKEDKDWLLKEFSSLKRISLTMEELNDIKGFVLSAKEDFYLNENERFLITPKKKNEMRKALFLKTLETDGLYIRRLRKNTKNIE